MKFTEHRDSTILTVKKYQPGSVTINNQTLKRSCFMNQHDLHPDWPCDAIETLTQAHLEALLRLQPEVILLGTGDKQIFPNPKHFAFCAQQGVGLEVMDNAAACRTYNVLTSEEREVVLALILPQIQP